MARDICPNCLQLSLKCLCSSIIEKTSPFKIIIIRDLKEKKHPFNTVNILQLNLKNIEIIDIDSDLNSDQELIEKIGIDKKNYLLFPSQNSQEISDSIIKNINFQLIILDGSWKKTKKIYFQSSFLQSLPALQLKLDRPSQYQIRKSSYEHSLSTIEAVTMALNLLTNKNYDELLNPFHRMVEIQLELEKNGKKKGSD